TQQAAILQTRQGLADRVPVDLEALGEIRLGRQARAGLEHPVANLLLQDLLDLAPDGDAAVARDLHGRASSCRLSRRSRRLSSRIHKRIRKRALTGSLRASSMDEYRCLDNSRCCLAQPMKEVCA